MIETQPHSEVNSPELVELDSILGSETFRRAPTLARILEYLCKCQLRGETFVKEYEIATEVMGRSSDFDPQQDGSVRVNLHHLRKKLRQFYEIEGASHNLWITLPIGRSLPVFVAKSHPEPAEGRDAIGEEEDVQDADPGESAIGTVQSRTEEQASVPAVFRSFPWAMTAAACVLILAAAAIAAWFWMRRDAMGKPTNSITDAALRFACGSKQPFVDSSGRVWGEDMAFHGGKSFHRPVTSIGGALDPTLYRVGREGDFSYDIPLGRGTYELHLYFAETLVHGEGFRTMDIAINGKRAERMLDITSDADGFGNATEKIYTGIQPASDGKLHIQFHGEHAPAFVNGIEIMPGNGQLMRPMRQTTLTSYYFDPQDTVWTPDAWFHGGRINHLNDLMPNLAWEGIYQSERFGNFSYSLPVVSNRTYTLTLYFQDAWFSHQEQLKSIDGLRKFTVTCNGETLLPQFDVLQQADGGFRLTKRFKGIRPNDQGKLLLTFVPSTNYAVVNAISVEEEPK